MDHVEIQEEKKRKKGKNPKVEQRNMIYEIYDQPWEASAWLSQKGEKTETNHILFCTVSLTFWKVVWKGCF